MKLFFIIVIAFIIALIIAYFGVNYFIMKDVKTPNYTVVEKTNQIEIRQYEPMITAEVTVTGDRETAINRGFKLLADYIFGNNTATGNKKIAMTAPVMQQRSEKIAMTAPVIQTASQDSTWTVRFVMPASYSIANLPKPNNPQVKLIEVPSKTMIAIRFSGRMSNANLESHLATLKNYISTHHINTIGEPEYAFYNPPWTLPLFRRNEILIAIKPKQAP